MYEENVATVYGFFMSKTWHKQTAEDLTSDVFVATFEQLRSTKNISDPKRYLYGVMKLKWLTYLREKYTKNQIVSVENIDNFSSYVDEEISKVKERSVIDRALPYIDRLPSSQREVLMLRYRDGLSLQEICDTLKKNMNYVKTTQKRGINSIRQLVEKGEVV